uniref:Uncharacterized protein n=1 Tax=Amphimedon queenslandica TaxID=400682 RepID=A0A1X7VFR4_AMPQE
LHAMDHAQILILGILAAALYLIVKALQITATVTSHAIPTMTAVLILQRLAVILIKLQ